MTTHKMHPDTRQALVFDHGWSLPVMVASTIEAAHVKAEALNDVMEWDQFDADYAAGLDLDTGKVEFPRTGFYYDADKMTLVKEVDEPTMDELVDAARLRLMLGY